MTERTWRLILATGTTTGLFVASVFASVEGFDWLWLGLVAAGMAAAAWLAIEVGRKADD